MFTKIVEFIAQASNVSLHGQRIAATMPVTVVVVTLAPVRTNRNNPLIVKSLASDNSDLNA